MLDMLAKAFAGIAPLSRRGDQDAALHRQTGIAIAVGSGSFGALVFRGTGAESVTRVGVAQPRTGYSLY